MEHKQYVFYQGEIVEEKDVTISIRSKAFNYGLAVFEGIRAYWDPAEEKLFAFALRLHYERMHQSAKCLLMTIPYTVDELIEGTIKLLKANGYRGNTYIRPIVYKGEETLKPTLLSDDDRIVIYTLPLNNYAGTNKMRCAVSSWRRVNDASLPARTKTISAYLNSALASAEITSRGYDEAIFLTDKGFVCEGPGENIFIVKGNQVITPPPSDDILVGITRNLVMRIAKEDMGLEVVERSISRTELYNSDEVFFSGTAMEVTAVVEVDDRIVADGEVGPVCGEIKERFFSIGINKNPKYADYCTYVDLDA